MSHICAYEQYHKMRSEIESQYTDTLISSYQMDTGKSNQLKN